MARKAKKRPTAKLSLSDQKIQRLVTQFKRHRNRNHRYASFDYCFNYFQSFRHRLKELAKEKHLQVGCLHLGFFLASWGMFRMSGKLGQEVSGWHFRKLIKEISTWNDRSPLGEIWNIDVNRYDEPGKIECLLKCFKKIRRLVLPKGQKNDRILVTKVMLGIFGCVPAFDGFFTDTFGRLFRKKGCAFSTFSKDALKKIGKFYGDHDTTINRLARETRTIDFQTGNQTDRRYTKAKIVDMIGFQKGRNVDEWWKSVRKGNEANPLA
jgi:hypothetical protein